VLGKGGCFFEKKSEEIHESSAANGLKVRIVDLKVGSIGVGLHGDLEGFKGVGLKCRDDLGEAGDINRNLDAIDKMLGSAAASEEVENPSSLRLLTNYTIVSVRPQKFVSFNDISLGRSITDVPEYLRQAITALRGGRIRAEKVSRLYVPFLVNWARTMDLSQEIPKKSRQLDDMITESSFSDLMREVPGLYLVALTFLDRAFKDGGEKIEESRQSRLKQFFLDDRRKWLRRLVRLDTEPSIPSGILSPTSRMRYAEELARRG
jgi:hypothetical protein